MKKYELTLVLPGGASIAKVKSVKNMVEKLVKTISGKVMKAEEWGKKELAGEIKVNSSGVFLHFILELDKATTKSFVEKLKMEDDVIRHLLVIKETSKSKGKKDKKANNGKKSK